MEKDRILFLEVRYLFFFCLSCKRLDLLFSYKAPSDRLAVPLSASVALLFLGDLEVEVCNIVSYFFICVQKPSLKAMSVRPSVGLS